MVVRCDYFLLVRLGWPAFAVICFCLLQGFPGDLAWSLGEGATLRDILQMFDEHYGVVMIFYTLSKSSIPSSRVWERIWLNLGCICPDTAIRVPGNDSAQTLGGDEV